MMSSERRKKFKPAIIIGATMLGIGGTGIAIVLTHYHPPKSSVITPKNPSGQVLSSSSVHHQDDQLRPSRPLNAGAATKPTTAPTEKAAPTTTAPAETAVPDASSPAQMKKGSR